MSKATYDAASLGRRIIRLAAEHGTPNSFAPSEVMPEAPMWLGGFLRSPLKLSYLNRGLRLHKLAVTYNHRALRVVSVDE